MHINTINNILDKYDSFIKHELVLYSLKIYNFKFNQYSSKILPETAMVKNKYTILK